MFWILILSRENSLKFFSVRNVTLNGLRNERILRVTWFKKKEPLANNCVVMWIMFSWFESAICFVWHFPYILCFLTRYFKPLRPVALLSLHVTAFQYNFFSVYIVLSLNGLTYVKDRRFNAFWNGKLNENAIWSMITY